MSSTAVKFLVAVCVSLMDVLVAGRYGGLLWTTFGPIAWARVGLLLIAGAIAFTLMDIWSKTFEPRVVPQSPANIDSALILSSTTGDLGGADV